jgi:hypothetical protein
MSGFHAIKDRWIDFAKSPAPEGAHAVFRGPLDGLASSVSGAVATYIGQKGRLGSELRAQLRLAVEQLEKATQEMDAATKAHIGLMTSIARSVLNTPDRPVKCGG